MTKSIKTKKNVKVKQEKLRNNATVEELFISSALNGKDTFIINNSGVAANWFHVFTDEWLFIEKFIQTHGKVPSSKVFKKKFSNFTIHKDVDDFDYLLEELKHTHARQVLIEELNSTAYSIKNNGIDSVGLAKRVRDTLDKVVHEVSGRQDELEVIENWRPIYREVRRRAKIQESGGSVGAPTGFTTLDLVTGGMQPGHFWTVGARLGEGKTWCLARMATTALLAGYRIQFDSLEQSRNQIAIRIHTLLQSKNSHNVFNSLQLSSGRNLDLPKYKKFLRQLEKNIDNQMFISDTSRGRVDMEVLAAQIERNRPNILFIDYLQLMADSEWQSVKQISADLATLKTRYNICIVAASQINRAGIAVGSKLDNPGAEHLSGSDAIGQDSDAVLTIRRISSSVNRLHLVKYRHGPDGQKFYAQFSPGQGVFEEVARSIADELIEYDKENDEEY